MEVLAASKVVDDTDVATSVSGFSDYQLWSVYYGGAGEEGEMLEDSEEELEDFDEREEEQEDADVMTRYKDKGDREKKQKSRELVAKDKDASEETLITPEEITVVSVESSTESSTNPCLVDIEISDSQLKLQNMYTMYPIPDDPGLVPAFWTTHEHPVSYPDDGVAKFFGLANILKVQPIRTVEDMLLSDKISLQYYGLNSRVVRPLCEALMKNPSVETINLTENWLSEDACYHLNDLLLRNQNVTTLLLPGCRIGAIGAARLRDGISNSTTLTTLDLSKCDIRKEGLEHVTEAVCSNSSLESLSLNDNHLDESCADCLENLLSCSKTLKSLELAWNSLYTVDTWRKLSRGLVESEALVDLDLSWNALGKECVPQLRLLLARSPNLTKLRLTGNRFYNEDAVVIARGLSRNQVLQELYLGNNPLKGAGALALAQAVTPERSPQSQLEVLDLTNVWADKDILPILEVIEADRPELDVRLGGILGNYKIVGPDVKALLLKRAVFEAMRVKNRRRRRNFGHFILSLTDNPVTKGKFTLLVREFGLRLSKSLLEEIMKAFAGERNRVNQELLKSVFMTQYPNTKPPPERPPKKKKVKGKKLKKGKKGKKGKAKTKKKKK